MATVGLRPAFGGGAIKRKPISEAEYVRLLKRTDELVGCTENSPEAKELEAIADQLDAYDQ